MKAMVVGILSLFAMATHAQVSLNAVDYSLLPGNQMQIQLTLSGPAPEVSSFTINDPPRLAIDLVGTRMALAEPSMQIESNLARQLRAVEAGGRTRLVLSMVNPVPYEIHSEGNRIIISLNKDGASTPAVARAVSSVQDEIRDIDFRRGDKGEGNITITLSNPASVINISERADKTHLDFLNIKVPDSLVRRLDVKDFATPVSFVDLFPADGGARMVITAEGAYEHMAYQTGNTYVVSFRQLSKEEEQLTRQDEFGYSGEKLSLNFQNIEVRAVLQLIADFTGLNVVASDTVQGNITLRLRNVPWDQALDIILKTRGLGMRQTGNVVLIAPNAELAARDKAEMEAQQTVVELAPLRTQFYQVNYARAADISSLLRSGDASILSARGNVTIDARTNTLMVLETADKHDDIARLIRRLDVPVSQVMIESRIVIANDDFSRDLGVRAGVSARQGAGTNSDPRIGVSGTGAGADAIANTTSPGNFPAQGSRYNVNFPAPGNAGRVAMAVLGGGYLVDLELSALQTEGRGEVVSNPRVITSNQRTAKIEQGVDIPYQEASASGATSVSFKKAVLSLEVTPQITPDERVSMDLKVNKDSVGGIFGGVPSIDTRSVETQVLVDNGDTVVLGGIYEQSTSEGASKVPLFGDIPLLGALFRSNSRSASKNELLIFVTPRILKEGMRTGME
ncbi:MAG: type IV pilus secretin PilQ [Chromatiales bacterium]|nr:type IV pilus secretin PilQ [Gammaproteobacteria bacterium]MBW6475871.1 type IV pilus secretin PilQ [Chromatiales bacterium]